MLRLKNEVVDYWKSLVRLLYPARCLLCEIPLVLAEHYLCLGCRKKVLPLKSPLCIKCSRPFPPYAEKRRICGDCRKSRHAYDRGFSLVGYSEPVKRIFHEIKYQNKAWLLDIFSPFLKEFANTHPLVSYDMMVPVPLDPKRRWEREFNQALILCRMLKRMEHRSPLTIRAAVVKKKKTSPQSTLGRTERLANLSGAFGVRGDSVRGKKILLIDDVFTTGSTVHECAKMLKEKGASQVDFLTMARALPNS